LVHGGRSFWCLFWGMLGLLGLDWALGAHNGHKIGFAAFFGPLGAPLGPFVCRPCGAGVWATRLLFQRGRGWFWYIMIGLFVAFSGVCWGFWGWNRLGGPTMGRKSGLQRFLGLWGRPWTPGLQALRGRGLGRGPAFPAAPGLFWYMVVGLFGAFSGVCWGFWG